MYAIVFIFNAALVAAFVSMTFHFWMRLPLRGEETHETRQRWLIEWAVKGIALPLLIWFIINLGPTRWLPPFLPQVDHLKNTGKPWFWPSIGMSSVAMGVVASYWAAMSLALLLEAIRRMTEDRGAFNGRVALWSLFTLPVAALVFALGGWVFAGFATAIWLAGVVHGTMPSHATTLLLTSDCAYQVRQVRRGRAGGDRGVGTLRKRFQRVDVTGGTVCFALQRV